MPNALALHLLFFFSGAAGLIYQIVWVRQFGNLFGNTVHSAALVTGVFMLGLGLGSGIVGRWADGALTRGRSLLRVYGIFEVAIGVIGLAIAAALPLFAPLSGAWSSYEVGAHGWHEPSAGTHALRYGVALVTLLPITTLMGGTLPLLIRHLLRDGVRDAGWRVGTLFGINTAGAAAGALAVAFFLVPAVGLFATQTLAVLVNLIVGLVALRVAKQDPTEAPIPAAAEAEQPEQGDARGIVALTGLAIAISGFAAMGMEIVWFRFLSSVLGGFRSTFALLLAVMLVGMWLGSVAAGALVRRFGRPAALYAVSQMLFVVATLVALLTYDRTAAFGPDLFAAYSAASPTGQRLLDLWSIVRVVLWFVAVPSLMMGFAYPLANALVQRATARVGARAGGLYLANTVGAVAGSTVAGFVLVPLIGIQRCVLLLSGVALLAIIPLALAGWRSAAPGRRRAGALVAGFALAVGLVPVIYWSTLPWYDLFRRTFHPATPEERLLTLSEGLSETIVITETPSTGARWLYTNNHPMSATRYDGLRYMRAFSHLPLLALDAPTDVLVICFGVGNTVHAASLHPSVERLEVADLSENVLRHAQYFERWNRGVLRDPRVKVFINDGRQHLRTRPSGRYDLVTLEPPPVRHAGMASLYSAEFYALARDRLKTGGFLTQWLPAYQTDDAVTLSMVRAFLEAFPDAVLLSGAKAELILVGRRDVPPVLELDTIRAHLDERPRVRADLRTVDLASLTEIAGTFVADAATLRRATADVPPLSDDLPLTEYGKANLGQSSIPPDLFDPSGIATWCPDCGRLSDLPAYLALTSALYAAPSFLTQGATDPSPVGPMLPAVDPAVARVWRGSGYIRWLYPELEASLPRE